MPNPSLADFTLSVTKAAFLRARSFKITRAVGMSVYRSVVLDDTDDWHKPIAEALGMYPHREVRRHLVRDEGMMFGQAELVVYALGETDDEADTAYLVIIQADPETIITEGLGYADLAG